MACALRSDPPRRPIRRSERPAQGVLIAQGFTVDNEIDRAVAIQINGSASLPSRNVHRSRRLERRHSPGVALSGIEIERSRVRSATCCDKIELAVSIEVGKINRHVNVTEKLRLLRSSLNVPQTRQVSEFKCILTQARVADNAAPGASGPIRIVPGSGQIESSVTVQIMESR